MNMTNADILRLAVQFLNVPPCPICDFRKEYCRCTTDQQFFTSDQRVDEQLYKQQCTLPIQFYKANIK